MKTGHTALQRIQESVRLRVAFSRGGGAFSALIRNPETQVSGHFRSKIFDGLGPLARNPNPVHSNGSFHTDNAAQIPGIDWTDFLCSPLGVMSNLTPLHQFLTPASKYLTPPCLCESPDGVWFLAPPLGSSEVARGHVVSCAL